MSKLLAILLFPLCCYAQVGVQPPMLYKLALSSTPGPQAIPGLSFYWVSSDMTVGWTVGANGSSLTNWVDRMQSAVWTNGNAARRPTNSASGVWFDGTNFQLTNNAVSLGRPRTWFIIFKPTRVNGSFDTILAETSLANDSWYLNASHINIANTAEADVAANHYIDMVIDTTGAGTEKWTTNNVSFKNNPGAAAGTLKYFFTGWDGADGKYQGYIAEIGFWTNSISTNAAWMTTLHTYATNTYNYTP